MRGWPVRRDHDSVDALVAERLRDPDASLPAGGSPPWERRGHD